MKIKKHAQKLFWRKNSVQNKKKKFNLIVQKGLTKQKDKTKQKFNNEFIRFW